MSDATTRLRAIRARAFTIPTERPESDGTLSWGSTTLVLVEVDAGGATGIGYTYCAASAARYVNEVLAEELVGIDAEDVAAASDAMRRRTRNDGPGGLAVMALSAVDVALWDLKSKLLGVPLASLLGRAREAVPAYGSGGFTSYSLPELEEHCATWLRLGVRMVKIKVGRSPGEDPLRARAARRGIGVTAQLFVDANGAYTRKQAQQVAFRLRDESDVTWLEEPVSSEDLGGLRLLRDAGPPGMAVTAGEYGYSLAYFRSMLEAGAVDVLQADATRCGGITGFLGVAALCAGFDVPLSTHCAPALHLPAALASSRVCHMELFHDHLRIEGAFFDGAPTVRDGMLRGSHERPGLGFAVKWPDLARYES